MTRSSGADGERRVVRGVEVAQWQLWAATIHPLQTWASFLLPALVLSLDWAVRRVECRCSHFLCVLSSFSTPLSHNYCHPITARVRGYVGVDSHSDITIKTLASTPEKIRLWRQTHKCRQTSNIPSWLYGSCSVDTGVYTGRCRRCTHTGLLQSWRFFWQFNQKKLSPVLLLPTSQHLPSYSSFKGL